MKCLQVVTYLAVLFSEVFTVSPDWPRICPDIVNKNRWGGRIAVAVDYAIIPIKYVIIHHTVTPECDSQTSCANIMKSIQNFHMDTMDFHDVGYNFVVGGDGKIYEGSGWHKVGAHTRGYNSRSIGLGFIGDFSSKRPLNLQIRAAKDFLECAIQLGELDKNYVLFGARQVSATASPGSQLFKEIQNWTHFVQVP
ncbi:unnamed protein product [Phaedon cochleariae]|uniref:Peptidoglycan-recognition protein n=1 Tax=Phaedon cochleariae TaxID=80249 RepID=A0A9P0GRE0_PHACE|nr:unnamed protein product [Phaedon cochleariae]